MGFYCRKMINSSVEYTIFYRLQGNCKSVEVELHIINTNSRKILVPRATYRFKNMADIISI
jgi:hypothetical protein